MFLLCEWNANLFTPLVCHKLGLSLRHFEPIVNSATCWAYRYEWKYMPVVWNIIEPPAIWMTLFSRIFGVVTKKNENESVSECNSLKKSVKYTWPNEHVSQFLLLARFFRNLGLCVLYRFFPSFFFFFLFFFGVFNFFWRVGPQFCYAAWMLDLIMLLSQIAFSSMLMDTRFDELKHCEILVDVLLSSLCVCFGFFLLSGDGSFFCQQQPTKSVSRMFNVTYWVGWLKMPFEFFLPASCHRNFVGILCFVVDFTIFPSARWNDELWRN